LVSGVDYQRPEVARRYSHGRGLPDEVLARWAPAVLPLLPTADGLVVLDLGAGTGIFARAWPRWRESEVISVEPAAAMRTEMVRAGIPEPVHVLAGRGEGLPLRDASVDVAWLSTVIHHLGDLDRCVAELRRVLAADGVVLIRSLFADRGQLAGLEFLPGWEQARAAFPATARIEAELSRHGLGVVCAIDVEDAGPSTVSEAADRIRRMRHADTLLGQFTDQQIADGLAAMDRCDPQQPLEPTTLGLLAFEVQ
jgi:SAM-dependent methyltransferase